MTDAICSLTLWALVQTTCAEYGLPAPSVYALIMAESGGDPLAVGDDGKAIGVAQFHRGTFDWLTSKYNLPNYWPDDALDPANAVLVLCAALDGGYGHHWRAWRRVAPGLVPEREHRMWAKASMAQLKGLKVK